METEKCQLAVLAEHRSQPSNDGGIMKIARMMFAGCLLLFLNFAVVAYAQEDKNESTKPAQQDEAKPGTAKPVKQD